MLYRGLLLIRELLTNGLLVVKLKSSLFNDLVNVTNICVTHDHGYVPFFLLTFRSFPPSWLMTGFVTREKLWAGATGGAGPAYLSIALEFTPVL